MKSVKTKISLQCTLVLVACLAFCPIQYLFVSYKMMLFNYHYMYSSLYSIILYEKIPQWKVICKIYMFGSRRDNSINYDTKLENLLHYLPYFMWLDDNGWNFLNQFYTFTNFCTEIYICYICYLLRTWLFSPSQMYLW